MYRFSLAAAAASLFMTGAALAHGYEIGDLVIEHPMAFETTKTAMSAGGFLSVTNTGTTADTLISAEADFPRVEIHTTEYNDGIAKMVHVKGIEIPPGETITLEPGGLHVMFMGLNGDPFEKGEEVPATLVFEKAGRVDVIFKVEERKAGDHSGHDHSGHGDG